MHLVYVCVCVFFFFGDLILVWGTRYGNAHPVEIWHLAKPLTITIACDNVSST